MEKLVDGKEYDLGATVGKYSKKDDVFLLGNTFVYRSETIYRDVHETPKMPVQDSQNLFRGRGLVTCKRCGTANLVWCKGRKSGKWYLVKGFVKSVVAQGSRGWVTKAEIWASRIDFHNCEAKNNA